MIKHKITLAALLGAAIALLVTGCAASAAAGSDEIGTDTSPIVTQSAEPTEAEMTEAQMPTQPRPTLGAVPTKEILIPMTAEPGAADSVPADLLALLKADAAQKANIDASQVEVISARAVTWNDGSLGCPKPGVMYTQALVPGYQVILSAGGAQYTYHTGRGTSFVECRPQLTSPKLPVTGEPGSPSGGGLKPPVSPGDPTR